MISYVFSAEERRQWRLLLRKALPVCAGILLAVLLNLADMWYIAMLGAEPIEAISFTFPVLMGLSHALIGAGTGITAVIARLEGADPGSTRGASASAILPFVVTCAVMAAAALLVYFYQEAFAALGASVEHVPYLRAYMPLWLGLCLPALALLTASNAALRGYGNTMTPAKCLGIAALVNGVLDPLLIFTLNMGVAGAALASVVAVWAAAFLSCRALLRHTSLRYIVRPVTGAVADIKRMFFIGFPATLSQTAPAIAQLYVTAALAGFGADYVAGYGIGMRAETVFLVIFMGIAAATTICAAGYYGAGDTASLQALKGALLKGCPLLGLGLTAAVMLVAKPVAAVAPSDSIMQTTLLYLYNAPMTIGLAGACMAVGAYFNGTMRPYSALSLYITRCILCLIPAGMILQNMFGAVGLYYAIHAANIAAYVTAVWLMIYTGRAFRSSAV